MQGARRPRGVRPGGRGRERLWAASRAGWLRRPEREGAELEDERGKLREPSFLLRCRAGREEAPVALTGEEVGYGDRHDRRRHGRDDSNSRERGPCKPAREERAEQEWSWESRRPGTEAR